eukprot:m.11054 g.11054  ORF g.11054 m.11054 type:complete len:308 (+) comp5663_c0_seq1:1663-2586(+)
MCVSWLACGTCEQDQEMRHNPGHFQLKSPTSTVDKKSKTTKSHLTNTMSDDLPPPLEDMSDQLALRTRLSAPKEPTKPAVGRATAVASSKAKAKTTTTETASTSSATVSVSAAKKTTPVAASATSKPKSGVAKTAKKKQSSGFGGFKAGFLLSGADKPKAKPKLKTTSSSNGSSGTKSKATSSSTSKALVKPEIETIRPKNPQMQPGTLPEVQEAMQSAQSFMEQTKDQWLNADLLAKFASSPVLAKGLADPEFVQALGEFQTNPSAAKAKYSSNPRVTEFFMEYFRVMGDHFTKMGDAEASAKAGK